MSRKTSEYKQCLNKLQDLHQKYPQYPLGRHISTALADYGDFWGITDKEFGFALDKYILELEQNIAPEYEISKIIEDANNLTLDSLYADEEEEDEY